MGAAPNVAPAERPLTGRRVVTTRDAPGALDARLRELGAEVVHLPLIEIVDPPDDGAALADALTGALAGASTGAGRCNWVVVTSRHGAARVGRHAPRPWPSTVRTASVGTATAQVLTEVTARAVDLVPEVQRGAALVEALAARARAEGDVRWRILVAQADQAEPALVDGLRRLGHHVEVHTAYLTRLRTPSAAELAGALDADAVAFASGSAATAWAQAIGVRTPPVVCAIGPTTARVARAAGLTVTAESSDHSVAGLARCVADCLATRPPPRN